MRILVKLMPFLERKQKVSITFVFHEKCNDNQIQGKWLITCIFSNFSPFTLEQKMRNKFGKTWEKNSLNLNYFCFLLIFPSNFSFTISLSFIFFLRFSKIQMKSYYFVNFQMSLWNNYVETNTCLNCSLICYKKRMILFVRRCSSLLSVCKFPNGSNALLLCAICNSYAWICYTASTCWSKTWRSGG